LRKDSEAIIVHFDDLIGTSDAIAIHELVESAKRESNFVSVAIQIERLTVCLNKEHQYRRLLELSLSSCILQLNKSEKGVAIEGSLKDLRAIDTDNYMDERGEQKFIRNEVRNVLSLVREGVVDTDKCFLQFVYKKNTNETATNGRS
jgi:hypothetical protein